MLVHHPHDLARVHGGAAAQGDDAVGLEAVHGLGAFLGAGQGGIGRHVEEVVCCTPISSSLSVMVLV